MCTLNSQSVQHTFFQCLNESEDLEGTILISGINKTFLFSKAKIEEHSETIKNFCRDLPGNFMASSGGGFTFLHLP